MKEDEEKGSGFESEEGKGEPTLKIKKKRIKKEKRMRFAAELVVKRKNDSSDGPSDW